MRRCDLTELPTDACGCAQHRNSPGFNAKHEQGSDAALLARPLAVSADWRRNPASDGSIHRADCWTLEGIEGFQKNADWSSYTPVDAVYIRANRDLCCSKCEPGRDL